MQFEFKRIWIYSDFYLWIKCNVFVSSLKFSLTKFRSSNWLVHLNTSVTIVSKTLSRGASCYCNHLPKPKCWMLGKIGMKSRT